MREITVKTKKNYRYAHFPHERLQTEQKNMDPDKRGFVMRIVGESEIVPHGLFLEKRSTSEQNPRHLAEIAHKFGLAENQVGSVLAHKIFFPLQAIKQKLAIMRVERT
jgi:hypothetical protein